MQTQLSPQEEHIDKETFDKLRSLLLQPEQESLGELKDKLQIIEKNPEWIASILPEAFIASREKGSDRLAYALAPTLESAIKDCIQQDPVGVASAIAPVMGASIRRAVKNSLRDMIESFNSILLRLFSIQGFKWRIEAMRTGKPYGEIVVMNTLLYRVREVYLVHSRTGILLCNSECNPLIKNDPELVLSMLTAIQEFVKGSFVDEETKWLDSITFGDHTVYVEHGPLVSVAAVVEGTPPPQFREQLQKTSDHISLYWHKQLEKFDGDTKPFENCNLFLQECLQSHTNTMKKKSYLPTLAFLTLLLLPIAFFSCRSILTNRKINQFVRLLDSHEGIIVTSAMKRNGRIEIDGIRDPLAEIPQKVVLDAGKDTNNLHFSFKSYIAAEDGIIKKRARKITPPPSDSVHYQVTDGILEVTGKADHRWVRLAKITLPQIPGVQKYDDSQLTDLDMKKLEHLGSRLGNENLFFPWNSSQLMPGQDSVLLICRAIIDSIEIISTKAGLGGTIFISGHTDKTGTEAANKMLSIKRARTASEALGITAGSNLKVRCEGVGFNFPLDPNAENEEERKKNRRAHLRVQFHEVATL